MPRANRFFLQGHVWHITHRCHQQQFLFKFSRDRARWLYWLFQARKRYQLCVLNYVVTSNHIHLLVQDRGLGEIADAMQLIEGRTAQEYNQRKARRGAFWEDRYHATAVDSERYLAECLVYIDMNMVRAGVVKHPGKWAHCGYLELQSPSKRYRIIDSDALLKLLGFTSATEMRDAHKLWVQEALLRGHLRRDERWTKSLAVGSEEFVRRFQKDLGITARYREVLEQTDFCSLNDNGGSYSIDFEPGIILPSLKIAGK